MRTIALTALCLGGLLMQGSAIADEWAPPKTETYYSADRHWRLNVVPRAIENPLAYFTDKVKGRSTPGAPPRNSERSARGFMEHLTGQTWSLVWNVPLANETSPVTALVSNRGSVATFDNWGSLGFGDDVVVIYDAGGRKIRSLALSDFLPQNYIQALPRSVSSIWWNGDHRFSPDGKQLILRIVVPSDRKADSRAGTRTYVDICVNMATGQVIPPGGADWNRALAQAVRVDEELREQEREQVAFHNSPLRVPATNDVTPWYRYLVEAFFRLDPNRDNGFPETKVLPRQGDANYPQMLGYVKDTLTKPIDDTGAIMFASPDQANLVHVIDKISSRLPPGKLPHARIYVTVTPALQAIAARAIARTDATFVPLDVTNAIPVRRPSVNVDAKSH